MRAVLAGVGCGGGDFGGFGKLVPKLKLVPKFDARLIPTCAAMADAPKPSPCSAATRLIWRRAVGARPRYLPSARARATPTRCRSSMIARSNSATAANIVSSIRPVGDLVSTSLPPKSRMRKATRLPSSIATMPSRSAVDRARRSSRVTTSVSPSRTQSSAASSWSRCATDDACSANSLLHPVAPSATSCASRPATCSTVDVRA